MVKVNKLKVFGLWTNADILSSLLLLIYNINNTICISVNNSSFHKFFLFNYFNNVDVFKMNIQLLFF